MRPASDSRIAAVTKLLLVTFAVSLLFTRIFAMPFPVLADEAAPSNASLTVSPSKLDFGTTAVSSASEAQTITLNNSGNAAVSLTGILISGIDFSENTSCGQSLEPGASCTVQVVFRPATTGPRLGTLTIDADRGSLRVIPLSGTGKEPE